MATNQDDNLLKKINYYFANSRLTKKEFARLIDVSEVTVQSILNGKQSIKVDTLQKIAEVLKVDVSDFFDSKRQNSDIENSEINDRVKELKSLIKLMKAGLRGIVNKYLVEAKNEETWLILISMVKEMEEVNILDEKDSTLKISISQKIMQHPYLDKKKLLDLMYLNEEIQEWICKHLYETGKSKYQTLTELDIEQDEEDAKKAIKLLKEFDESKIPVDLTIRLNIAFKEFSKSLEESLKKMVNEGETYQKLELMGLLDDIFNLKKKSVFSISNYFSSLHKFNYPDSTEKLFY